MIPISVILLIRHTTCFITVGCRTALIEKRHRTDFPAGLQLLRHKSLISFHFILPWTRNKELEAVMKPHRCKETVAQKLIIVNLTMLFLLVLLGTGYAKPPESAGPPFSFPGSKKGQEAITALRDRLPAVASRYGKSPEKLKKLLLQDNDLWLDSAENLLYLCSFAASEAETLPETGASAIPTGPFPLDQTFRLHSLAGAAKTIYLDFDGHVTSGTYWNSYTGGADIVSLPYDFNGNTASFSDDELSRIQNIWARVAEDFAAYNIDVTTEDPGVEALRRNNSGDGNFGIRVVISPTSSWYGSAGGVAYVGSFNWNSDTPVFVFSNKLGNGSEKYVTDAASHETGHSLGLSHDGTTDGTAYYTGHGSWAPIMGVGYSKTITQWSKGEYANANNTEDDLAVMLNYGAGYRPDDHGDWIDDATMLGGDTLDAAGIIERSGDMDVFAFQAEAGNISINIEPAHLDPNLDIFMQILDDGGNVLGEDDPYYILPASLNLNLPAGTYYILVDGVGTGNPDTGYSDYASLGQYFISGSLPTTQFPPTAPTGLSASPASASQISLNWSDNSTNENGFTIERSPNGVDGWTEIGFSASNITTYTDTELVESTTYHYRVAAYNIIGNSGYSNTANARTFALPPAAPSNLAAIGAGSGQIDLTWTDNATNESGFVIERSPNGSDSWTEIATLADNITSYTDTGLTSGTTFFYRVSAYNLNGNSGFSNTASATTTEEPPAGPSNLSAVASSSAQIDLHWQDNSNNEAGFRVERSDTGYAPWTEITDLGANTTTFSDSSLAAGTTYYYRVSAYNPAGSSGASNIALATTDEPPQFIDQTATQEASVSGTVSGSFLDLQAEDSTVEIITEQTSGGRPSGRYSYLEHKWIIPVQPAVSFTLFANVWSPLSSEGDTFVFAYSTDDENYTDMFTVSAEFDDDTYHVFPLPANLSGTIYIRVTDTLRSAGSYDKDTLFADHLFIRCDNEPGLPPLAPDSLTAAGVSFDAIALSWADQADNELGFNIERSTDGIAGWEAVGSTGPDAVAFIDSGLRPDTIFYYRVQAFNAAGVSSFSNTANGATTQADTLHVGDLYSYTLLNRNRWDAYATVTVHNQNTAAVAGVTVTGVWDTNKTGTCVTDDAGQCTVSNTRLKISVTGTSFSVTGLELTGYVYDPASDVADGIDVSSP